MRSDITTVRRYSKALTEKAEVESTLKQIKAQQGDDALQRRIAQEGFTLNHNINLDEALDLYK